MPIIVNTNVPSLFTQRTLGQSTSALDVSLQRLSSGLRINSAKDDAAGSAVSTTLTTAIRGNNQAVRNAADGISVGQTTEGAMGQIVNNMQRIREIAVQAANGSLTDTNRSQLQLEVDQLTQENTRIIQTTNFNGVALLSGSSTLTLTFQVGFSGATNNQVTVTGANLSSLSTINNSTTGLTAIGVVNVSTSGAASGALSTIDTDLATVTSNRAVFGAVQNRFEAVIANLQNYVENLSASRSRIQDTDFAAETSALTRNQILQQAGIAMLSQANQLPQSALSLLR